MARNLDILLVNAKSWWWKVGSVEELFNNPKFCGIFLEIYTKVGLNP